MFKTIAVIASAAIFTIFGIVVGLIIVLNRPVVSTDGAAIATAWIVVLPTLGGSAVGLYVGLLATDQIGRDKL